jgi:hypothetical protein
MVWPHRHNRRRLRGLRRPCDRGPSRWFMVGEHRGMVLPRSPKSLVADKSSRPYAFGTAAPFRPRKRTADPRRPRLLARDQRLRHRHGGKPTDGSSASLRPLAALSRRAPAARMTMLARGRGAKSRLGAAAAGPSQSCRSARYAWAAAVPPRAGSGHPRDGAHRAGAAANWWTARRSPAAGGPIPECAKRRAQPPRPNGRCAHRSNA